MANNKDADARQYLRAMRNMNLWDSGIKPGHSEFGAVGDRGYETPPRTDGTRYRPLAATQSLRRPD